MRSISNIMPTVTDKCLGKKGHLFGRLLQNWRAIVGEDRAQVAVPQALKLGFIDEKKGKRFGGSLTLRVASANATLIQHELPLWIEKINTFLGHEAIEKIKLDHKSYNDPTENKTRKKRKERPTLLSTREQQEIEEMLISIDDPDLKETLRSYAVSLHKSLKKR